MKKIISEEADKIHKVLQKSHQKALKKRNEQIFNIDSKECKETNEIYYNFLNEKSDILKNSSQEDYEEILETLNNIAFINKRINGMKNAKTELENKWEKENGNKKIPDKKQINFTDSDSCIMVTKHYGVQQCYNHFALVDDKAHIILGTYTSNNSSDQLGLIPTIENTEKTYGSLKGFQLGADAGFFSASNILYTKGKSIPEPVWGNIKTQDGLVQMHYRGIEKSSLEFKLHCVMHNIRKILFVVPI